jgi:hypothetical protein
MKKVVKARIEWLLPEEGGRKRPPVGPKYSTVVHFEDDTTDWPEVAWSLVVDFNEPQNRSPDVVANIWFLAHDNPNAPNHLLRTGSRFQLFEGSQVVAKGEVLAQ